MTDKRERTDDQDSDILKHVHRSALALLKAGAINQTTMRDFDKLCIPNIAKFPPAEIVKIRKDSNTSQALFAQYLNTSTSTIRQWESGDKSPSGFALKLLDLVKKHGLNILAK